MKYIYNPVTGTLDDVETPNLGEKYFASAETDEIIKTIDDKFGPGTMFPASDAPTPPKTIERDMFDNAFRDNAADGGMMRQNFKLGSPPSMAISYGIKKALLPALETMGVTLSAARLAEIATENPTVFNNIAAYVSAIPGRLEEADEDIKNKLKEYIFRSVPVETGDGIYIGPDADEMEREAEKIRELTKTKGFEEGKQLDIPLTTGGSEPPKIETKEEFPAETKQLPDVEGFPAETQQLPIIFENKKVESVKKKFDKVDDEYDTRDKGYAKRIDNIYNKDFANKVKNIVDTTYGGNVAALAGDLGIERVRINTLLKKHGIKTDKTGNKTIQNIFLKKNKNKLSVSDLTTNIKGNEAYLIDRAKERFVDYDKNKNKFVNYRDIAEIIGVNLPDKTAQDFFQTKLRNANKKVGIETKKGSGKEILYNLEDTINSLTKSNLSKPISGTGRVQDKERSKFEQQDLSGFNTRRRVMASVNETSKNILGEDQFIKNAGEEIGHAEAIANQIKYKKLYKKSNANDISTLIYQDKSLNKDVLQKYGEVETAVEQKRQPILNKIESFIGKKRTIENDNTLSVLVDELNQLNKTARKEILQIQKENKFIRNQKNRIADFKLTLPEDSKTYQSGILNIDMSNIDPSVSVGRILEINPNAKTFDDLTEEQQATYRENMKNQMIDYLQYFYQKSGIEREDIQSLVDELSSKKISSGKIKKASGGSIELSPMPRIGFNGGGAVGADDDFAKELEYFLLNPDAELPKADSYRETMNPVALVNDMIDPRNYAYYGDRLAETGVRIGEFGARVLPALGQLTADLIQRPAFKVTGGTGQGYIQDYTDVMPSNIKGTGIFSEFLDNLVGTEGTKVITEKTGLADLIRSEEQKQKDRRSTIGPKVLADQVTLGAELTAPIFPGLKLLKAYAKNRKLPVDDTTRQVMEKEIDEVLATQNVTRRDFLKVAGAGGAVVLAKMLGFGDELATATKVTEKVAKDTVSGIPTYFPDLISIIKTKGKDVTKKSATKDLENVYEYKGFDLYEDVATGSVRVEKLDYLADNDLITERQILSLTKNQGDETTKMKPADEYEEVTEVNSKIYKDNYNDPDYEEGIDIEEILRFIKNEKIN